MTLSYFVGPNNVLLPFVDHLDQPVVKQVQPAGPGSILSVAINVVLGFDAMVSCACTSRILQMNSWGWKGCWERLDAITGWLIEEAVKRDIAITPATPEAVIAKGLELAKGREIPAELLEKLGAEVDRNDEAEEVVRLAVERFGRLAGL